MTRRRVDGRAASELREVEFIPGFAPAAKGSVLARFGRTRVLCGVSVEESVPRWMRQQNVEGGWLTAEYSILPYATPQRTAREVSAGRVGGRTQEIQRLIGRALRAVTDLKVLGARTLWIDCDVIEADGGTRTAAITGAYVALRLAVASLRKEGLLTEDPVKEAVAAVSVGLVDGRAVLDLCYEEDVKAAVDMNVVMTAGGQFVEIQGTAEKEPFSEEQTAELLSLAKKGIRRLLQAQAAALRAVR
jgi:ribonuclease PH